MNRSILFMLFLLTGLAPESQAGSAYHYRAPDGSMVFTDQELAAPYVFVRKMRLNWGDVRGREIPQRPTAVKKAERREAVGSDPEFTSLVNKKAIKYNILPELIHAVIEAESAYDPKSVSTAGAVGLMQLMPGTAKRFGVNDRTDPDQNVDAGANYLRTLLDLFDNDVKLALASYNAGEGAVIKYGRIIPPYSETRNYVARVLRYLRRNLRERQELLASAGNGLGG
ncbi:MAG: lytic transglycosylase domain-containing protein [Gammaproteobacteria bacterium]|jgi:soluble lytic murein transglycosylase-like protein